MFSEETLTALRHATEAMTAAWEEMVKELAELVCEAQEEMVKELAELVCEAQEEIEARKEERQRWGHPPKRLLAVYRQPVKRIRPCARSFGRR